MKTFCKISLLFALAAITAGCTSQTSSADQTGTDSASSQVSTTCTLSYDDGTYLEVYFEAPSEAEDITLMKTVTEVPLDQLGLDEDPDSLDPAQLKEEFMESSGIPSENLNVSIAKDKLRVEISAKTPEEMENYLNIDQESDHTFSAIKEAEDGFTCD